MPRDRLGPFEAEILRCLMSRPRDAYGVSILDRLKEDTGRSYTIGALYTTLERLETKGLIRSRWGEPTAERGGRRKRYYEVSASGSSALHAFSAATVYIFGVGSSAAQGA